jgi:hypothetical protein
MLAATAERVGQAGHALETQLPVAKKFMMDAVEGRVKYVREFVLKNTPVMCNRPILVRAAEATGLAQQWFVIEHMNMQNVDTFPSDDLGRWVGDVETHIEFNGFVYRSAITLDLDYLTMKEIKSALLYLRTVYDARVQIEKALMQSHLSLLSEDAERTPNAILIIPVEEEKEEKKEEKEEVQPKRKRSRVADDDDDD